MEKQMLTSSNNENKIKPTIVSGRQIQREVLRKLKKEVQFQCEENNIRAPKLSIVLVGTNAGSVTYVKHKMRASERVGIKTELFHFHEDVKASQLLNIVNKLNNSEDVDSILCQLPLPENIPKMEILNAISRKKDVDCLQDVIDFPYMNKQFQISESLPCTPNAIMTILDHYNIPLEGKKVVVLGKGLLVGYPLSTMLIQRYATVTTLDEYCLNIKEHVQEADVVISATGVRHLVQESWIKPGAAVIDAGANRPDKKLDKNKKIVGDVDFDNVQNKAGLLTPVPGGVGPVTVAMLLQNVVGQWKTNFNLNTKQDNQNNHIIQKQQQEQQQQLSFM